ncbi:hypothetical protein PIB30_059558 [Stylosanthes scabra]|uniref:Uncharacterized protein n=1 Tax=Stylosanthes scabra TaxID=79078 RepID=A0ABU6XLS4_9FABA|nr:hypothetical protein [Stylosanthes scabra]
MQKLRNGAIDIEDSGDDFNGGGGMMRWLQRQPQQWSSTDSDATTSTAATQRLRWTGDGRWAPTVVVFDGFNGRRR